MGTGVSEVLVSGATARVRRLRPSASSLRAPRLPLRLLPEAPGAEAHPPPSERARPWAAGRSV